MNYRLFRAKYVLLSMAFFIFIVSLLPETISKTIVNEGGPVEQASALLWFIAAALIIFCRREGLLRRLTIAMLPLFCGMRELDLHKQWTTDSVLKSNYWLREELQIPGYEKFLAGVVLIAFLLAIFFSVRFFFRSFIKNLRLACPIAISIFTSIVLLFISKIFLDGLEHKLRDFDLIITIPFYTTIAEEIMELTASLLIFIAVIFWIRKNIKPNI